MATFNIQINEVVKEIVGQNVIAGQIIYLSGNSKWYIADATTHAKSTKDLRIALETATADTEIDTLAFGYYEYTDGQILIPGATYRLSEIPGQGTTQVYLTSGYTVRNIGTAFSSTVLLFNPDETYITENGKKVNDIDILQSHTHLEVDILDLDKYTKAEVDALVAGGGGGGDAYLANTQTFTGANTFESITNIHEMRIVDPLNASTYLEGKYLAGSFELNPTTAILNLGISTGVQVRAHDLEVTNEADIALLTASTGIFTTLSVINDPGTSGVGNRAYNDARYAPIGVVSGIGGSALNTRVSFGTGVDTIGTDTNFTYSGGVLNTPSLIAPSINGNNLDLGNQAITDGLITLYTNAGNNYLTASGNVDAMSLVANDANLRLSATNSHQVETPTDPVNGLGMFNRDYADARYLQTADLSDYANKTTDNTFVGATNIFENNVTIGKLTLDRDYQSAGLNSSLYMQAISSDGGAYLISASIYPIAFSNLLTPSRIQAHHDTATAFQTVATTNWAYDYLESSLGNPPTDGYILSSLADGTRSWVANTGGVGGCCLDSNNTWTGWNTYQEAVTVHDIFTVSGQSNGYIMSGTPNSISGDIRIANYNANDYNSITNVIGITEFTSNSALNQWRFKTSTGGYPLSIAGTGVTVTSVPLTVGVNPTQGTHVGNRDYNDGRYLTNPMTVDLNMAQNSIDDVYNITFRSTAPSNDNISIGNIFFQKNDATEVGRVFVRETEMKLTHTDFIELATSNVNLSLNETFQQVETTNDPNTGNGIGNRDYNDNRYAPIGQTGGSVTSVTAGAGMTQTGTATINPTLNIIGGAGITVNNDNIEITETGVNPGTYTNATIIVDATGRVTSAATGTSGGGTVDISTSGSITGGPITGTGTISHLTTAGHKHIPSGGSAGQFLKYSASGTAVWANDNDTIYTHPTTAGNKHMPTGGSVGQVLINTASGTATWQTAPWTSNTGDITAVTAGTGLDGGGTSGSVTLSLNFAELTDMTANISGATEFIIQNGAIESRKRADEIQLGNFVNNLGWTSNTGDITQVTAGNGLTGGATSGAATLNVVGGTGITANANDIALTNTSVTPGTYNLATVTVDAQGRITAASSGSAGGTGTVTSVSVGTGLDITNATTTPNITVDLSEFSAVAGSTFNPALDYFIVLDGTVERKVLMNQVETDWFNNTAGWTTNTGTVTSVGITAGTGIAGGGTITSSGTLSLSLNFAELADMTAAISGDTEFIVQNGAIESRKRAAEISLSNFVNDAGWTSNIGDITGVTAGNGLTGGGSSGSVTINAASHAGTAGSIGTINVQANTLGVNLGTSSTTAAPGNHTHSNYITSNASDTATGIYSFTNSTASSSSTTGAVKITGGVGIVGNIYCGSKVYAPSFYESSDVRLKENIVPLDNTFSNFNFKEDNTLRYGVIAQEVEKTNPEFVETDGEGMKSVNYIDLLVKELVELKARVKELEDGNR